MKNAKLKIRSRLHFLRCEILISHPAFSVLAGVDSDAVEGATTFSPGAAAGVESEREEGGETFFACPSIVGRSTTVAVGETTWGVEAVEAVVSIVAVRGTVADIGC